MIRCLYLHCSATDEDSNGGHVEAGGASGEQVQANGVEMLSDLLPLKNSGH
jgi:hypothetical protein